MPAVIYTMGDVANHGGKRVSGRPAFDYVLLAQVRAVDNVEKDGKAPDINRLVVHNPVNNVDYDKNSYFQRYGNKFLVPAAVLFLTGGNNLTRLSRRNQLLADSSLLLIAMVWGANFVIIKGAITQMPPMEYLGIRFLLAFLLLFSIFSTEFLRLGQRELLQALGVGLLLFGGFAAQTVGLQSTTPGVSGFLTVTYVAMVPLLLGLWQGKPPDIHTIQGTVLTLLGVGLLTLTDRIVLAKGELLTLAGAFFFALHILALDQVTNRIHPIVLTGIQLGTVGLLSLLSALLWEPIVPPPLAGWGAILYGALFGSILAYMVQTTAQRYTLPSHAAILLSMEAVFALLFSLLAGMETMTLRHVAGFALVIAGVLAIEVWPMAKNSRAETAPHTISGE